MEKQHWLPEPLVGWGLQLPGVWRRQAVADLFNLSASQIFLKLFCLIFRQAAGLQSLNYPSHYE
jgi:hypothetical protein